MSEINTDWKIEVFNSRVDVDLVYLPIIVRRNPASTDHSAVQIGTDQPVNAVNFSLSAQLESGSLEWNAYSKPGKEVDFSDGTLQEILDEGSISSDEANRIAARFSTDSDGDYTVQSITEQRIWLKEYIHDPSLSANWELSGPSWTNRVNIDEGTPIFITNADIEPLPDRPFEGTASVSFQLGGRL